MYLMFAAAKLVLSALFLIAGTSKLKDGFAGIQKALVEFGVPSFLTPSLGFVLPFVELAIGCALLPVRSSWYGAIGALALLLLFSTAIAANLVVGRKPPCNCFGQLQSKPIGWTTLARNGLFGALAALLVWQIPLAGNVSIWQTVSGFSARELTIGVSVAVVSAALGLEGFLILHLFRQNGRLLLRIEALEGNRLLAGQPAAQQAPVLRGIPIGSPAVPFDLPNLEDGTTSLAKLLRAAKPLLLIFSDPNCGPCNALMPDIAKWQNELVGELSLAIISSGTLEANRAKTAEHGLKNVLVEKQRKIAEKYSALGTPTAVLIRADGTVGSNPMGGADAIRQLIAYRAWTAAGLAAFTNAIAKPAQAPQPAPPKPALPVGSAAPVFKLQDLAGNTFDLAASKAKATVLLFWNPGCGFCQRMIIQLKEWEQAKPANAPRLVLVSTGAREANQAMGLQSTVLIDDKFAVGQMYAASGTPSGMLIDANGKVASVLAVGAPAVMELLATNKEQSPSAQLALASVNA